MIERLGMRLEDTDESTFTPAMKLAALNTAQISLANMLHNAYLTELQVFDEDETVTTGVYALSGLDHGVLKGAMGIQRVVDSSTGYDLTMMDISDVRKNKNTLQKATVNNPQCYIYQSSIYALPTSITAIDVYYLRVPATMYAAYTATGGTQTTILTTDTQLTTDGHSLSQVADYYNGAIIYNVTDGAYFKVKDFAYANPTYTFTVDDPGAGTAGANAETFYILTHGFDTLNLDGVTCQLNQALHNTVVSLAEAECWGMVGKAGFSDRRAAALSNAYKEVEILNARYEVERPTGIGTDRKGR